MKVDCVQEPIVDFPDTEALPDEDATSYDLIFPDWEGVNAKGRETRKSILRAALAIMIAEGYKELTMRRVAALCGIGFGNLTYHYPTWNDLLTELIEAIVRFYEHDLDRLDFGRNKDAESRLQIYVQMNYSNVNRITPTKVLPDLWSLANHNPFVEERLYELYSRVHRPVIDIVAEIRPDLTAGQHLALAVFMSSSFEGMVIFAGYDKPYMNWGEAFSRMSVQCYMQYIKTVKAQDIGELPGLASNAYGKKDD